MTLNSFVVAERKTSSLAWTDANNAEVHMRRASRLGCLMLVILGMCTPPAEAKVWDWLEELSGPGPFEARYPGRTFLFNIICTDTGATKNGRSITGLHRLGRVPDPKKMSKCLFVDQRWFVTNNDSSRFYRTMVKTTEFGPAIRLHPALEVGAGLGGMWFTSESPEKPFRATQWTITFPRVVFMPLLAIPGLENAGWGFFKMYFRESVIVGTVDQNDIATKPGNTFSVNDDRVRSAGFIIDITALVPGLHDGIVNLKNKNKDKTKKP